MIEHARALVAVLLTGGAGAGGGIVTALALAEQLPPSIGALLGAVVVLGARLEVRVSHALARLDRIERSR